MGEKLTDDQLEFLLVLESGPKTRRNLPLADRSADRVRQSVRLFGYAEYKTGFGWIITPAGRAALASTRKEPAP